MLRPPIAAAAVTALIALAACGDDDTEPTAREGDVGRYCALTRELDGLGESFFSALGEDATAQQFAAAERRFLAAQAERFAELGRVAPRQIGADVRVLLAAMRGRAGLQAEVSERASTAAEERVQAFEERRCS